MVKKVRSKVVCPSSLPSLLMRRRGTVADPAAAGSSEISRLDPREKGHSLSLRASSLAPVTAKRTTGDRVQPRLMSRRRLCRCCQCLLQPPPRTLTHSHCLTARSCRCSCSSRRRRRRSCHSRRSSGERERKQARDTTRDTRAARRPATQCVACFARVSPLSLSRLENFILRFSCSCLRRQHRPSLSVACLAPATRNAAAAAPALICCRRSCKRDDSSRC